MNIVITGSRECNNAMCQKIHEITAWAKANNHTILTGDAHGVDVVTRADCRKLHIPCSVYGAFNRFRLSNMGGHLEDCRFADYTTRDKFIVDHADLVIAVWNGKSSGTRLTFQYARVIGKKTIVRTIPDIGGK